MNPHVTVACVQLNYCSVLLLLKFTENDDYSQCSMDHNTLFFSTTWLKMIKNLSSLILLIVMALPGLKTRLKVLIKASKFTAWCEMIRPSSAKLWSIAPMFHTPDGMINPYSSSSSSERLSCSRSISATMSTLKRRSMETTNVKTPGKRSESHSAWPKTTSWEANLRQGREQKNKRWEKKKN